MAVAGPFFDFCIRLSLPVKQNLEDSLADYGRHIADHLVFIPFHFFHLIRLSLKGGSLSYPATEAETILTKEEAKLLARAVRAVEVSTGYLRRLAESAGETGPMAPELILPPLLLGRGDQDPFYSAPQLKQDLATLGARGFEAEVVRYAGGHTWDPAFLQAVGRFLARVQG